MQFINLTNHDITLLSKGKFIHVPQSGPPARIYEDKIDQEPLVIDGIPVKLVEHRTVINDLPDPKDGIMYIVSSWVAKEVANQYGRNQDIVFPDDFVKDDDGHIYGARQLRRFPVRTTTKG